MRRAIFSRQTRGPESDFLLPGHLIAARVVIRSSDAGNVISSCSPGDSAEEVLPCANRGGSAALSVQTNES